MSSNQPRPKLVDRASCTPSAVEQADQHLSHRGARRPRPPVASAWQCEGRWQAADQMDIWQCCDEVELDRQRASGDDSDDEDTPDTDEQHRD